jgi:hypothetical protein
MSLPFLQFRMKVEIDVTTTADATTRATHPRYLLHDLFASVVPIVAAECPQESGTEGEQTWRTVDLNGSRNLDNQAASQ